MTTMATSRRAVKAEVEAEAEAWEASDEILDSPTDGALARDDHAEPSAEAPATPSKLTSMTQFALAVTLSFGMASIGYRLLGEFGEGDLATMSRAQDTWEEVGILAGWRL
jgi:hypothetical protein